MIFGDILLEAVIDTVKTLPFLFAAYLIIEVIERKKSHTVEGWLAKGGRFGFAPGAALGIVPQCGFSAMAANLYASRVVSLGALIAVFIATSDEAVPLMLSNPRAYPAMLALMACKLAWALAAGFVLDIAAHRLIPGSLRGGYKGGESTVDCHHHREKDGVFFVALKHTAGILAVLFLFTAVLGGLVELVGEEAIEKLLAALGPGQPLMAGLFGLAPNCAASVIITQLYLSGSISFGSMLAGLCTGAGTGLLVLFRLNRSVKQNVFIVGLLWVFGVMPGFVLHLLMPPAGL